MEEKIRYTEILFPSELPFSNYVVNESKPLAPVSLVNIFIGSNNCGKSRLLRSFFSCQKFKYNTNFYNYKDFYSLLAELNIEYKSCFHSNVSAIGNLNLYNIDKIIGSMSLLQKARKRRENRII
jgi:hypothetical protein